jgi:beta-lactamase class A
LLVVSQQQQQQQQAGVSGLLNRLQTWQQRPLQLQQQQAGVAYLLKSQRMRQHLGL